MGCMDQFYQCCSFENTFFLFPSFSKTQQQKFGWLTKDVSLAYSTSFWAATMKLKIKFRILYQKGE